MADFFEKLKNDIEKGWDSFKDALKDTAYTEGEQEREHLEEENMLYSWARGKVISLPYLNANASGKDQMMRTLAVMMIKDNELVSPCNGVVVGIEEDDNTIAIALNKEVVVAVKVCVSCADFSKDARILVNPGQRVKTGEALVSFNHEIEAKSKLLLVKPESVADFTALGFQSDSDLEDLQTDETTQPLISRK